MKKILLSLTLVVVATVAALAQKPTAGAKGFSFGVSGLDNIGVGGANQTATGANAGTTISPTLLFRYYLADGLAARVGLNYQRSGSTTTSDATKINGTKTETKTVASGAGQFAIQLGIQKSLGESEKLEPYVGADLLFGTGKLNGQTETTTTVTDATLAGGQNGDFSKTKNKLGSTTRFGLLPTVGFNYYFVENFAFGAEFNWGFVYNSVGTGETTTTTQIGGTTTTTTTATGSEVKGGTFGSFGSGFVSVSVFF